MLNFVFECWLLFCVQYAQFNLGPPKPRPQALSIEWFLCFVLWNYTKGESLVREIT